MTWKPITFSEQTRQATVALHDRRSAIVKKGKQAAAEHRAANANIGSDAEIAAYLARVPKPYHYVDEPQGDE